MASTEPAVVCSGLVRRYGERRALDGIDLTLGEGQTLVVFGPNGAGKTTLLRVLSTLLRPSEGDASLLGSDLRKEGWKVRSKIRWGWGGLNRQRW
jgi:ABC-type multidrug transport system ATPase subunit